MLEMNRSSNVFKTTDRIPTIGQIPEMNRSTPFSQGKRSVDQNFFGVWSFFGFSQARLSYFAF
jgi:hypothetical protein